MSASVRLAGVQLAGDRQRDQQDRVAERVLVGAGAEASGQVQEFLGQGGGLRSSWHVRHGRSVTRFVRRSKRFGRHELSGPHRSE